MLPSGVKSQVKFTWYLCMFCKITGLSEILKGGWLSFSGPMVLSIRGFWRMGGGSCGVWTHYKSGSSLLATNMCKGLQLGRREIQMGLKCCGFVLWIQYSLSTGAWGDSLLHKHIQTKTNRSFEFMTIPFCYASNHFHTLHSFSLILNLNFWDKVGIWLNRRHLQMSSGQEHELGRQTHGACTLTAPPISR